MSELEQESSGEPSQVVSSCPLSPDILPEKFRKNVDPETALKRRMMAAKALMPMPPPDQITTLYFLSYDPDEDVRETASETARSMPDNILATVLRGDLIPEVLAFLSGVLSDKPAYTEMILLNIATSDETFARLARVVDDKLLNIIVENQLRLLRHADIVVGIEENPNASQAVIDRVFDFAVRSGLKIENNAAYQAARERILGVDEATREVPLEETAEGLIEQHAEDLRDEPEEEKEELPEEELEKKRVTLTQAIFKMSVSEKIKMASIGNKEARTLLLRDSNKLVQEAVIKSARMTEGEVIGITNSRIIPEPILRYVLTQRDWMKNYQIKCNLIENPKTPLPTAMRLLPFMRAPQLKALGANKNIANSLKTQAKNMLEKRSK